MLTNFIFTFVYALDYAGCANANLMGFTNLLGRGHPRRFGLFGGTSKLHAGTVRTAGACC